MFFSFLDFTCFSRSLNDFTENTNDQYNFLADFSNRPFGSSVEESGSRDNFYSLIQKARAIRERFSINIRNILNISQIATKCTEISVDSHSLNS